MRPASELATGCIPLAKGEPVDLTEGVLVRADPHPTAIRALMQELQSDGEPTAVLTVVPTSERARSRPG